MSPPPPAFGRWAALRALSAPFTHGLWLKTVLASLGGLSVNSPPIFRIPILVVGLKRMFTGGTIRILTHGQMAPNGKWKQRLKPAVCPSSDYVFEPHPRVATETPVGHAPPNRTGGFRLWLSLGMRLTCLSKSSAPLVRALMSNLVHKASDGSRPRGRQQGSLHQLQLRDVETGCHSSENQKYNHQSWENQNTSIKTNAKKRRRKNCAPRARC